VKIFHTTLILVCMGLLSESAIAGRFKDVEVRGKILDFEDEKITIEEEETGFVVYVSPSEVFVPQSEGGNQVLREPAERAKRKGKPAKAYIPEKKFFPDQFFQ